MGGLKRIWIQNFIIPCLDLVVVDRNYFYVWASGCIYFTVSSNLKNLDSSTGCVQRSIGLNVVGFLGELNMCKVSACGEFWQSGYLFFLVLSHVFL